MNTIVNIEKTVSRWNDSNESVGMIVRIRRIFFAFSSGSKRIGDRSAGAFRQLVVPTVLDGDGHTWY